MTERKLASIQRVVEIRPIDGADAIEVVRVLGWDCVAKKGEFSVGQPVVYFEIDSILPVWEKFEFLRKSCHVKKDWIPAGEGFRLKTIRLRGQVSQGLVIPVDTMVGSQPGMYDPKDIGRLHLLKEGDDVTELLQVVKWDPPVAAELAGQAKGNFPSFVRKTDQERCISAGTLIDTSLGKIPIEKIVEEKMELSVATYNHKTNTLEFRPVIGWGKMTRKRGWVKITLKSGINVVCTDNHKIWCEDIKAYREAQYIQPGQKFIKKTE